MALSDKNIVITPNIGQSADPKIVFSGADGATGANNITLTAYPTNSGTLSFEGSVGQLFSITNSLTGTIFSVNDISGIPSIEVIDTGLVKLAQYSGRVLIGTGTDNTVDKLQITGSMSVSTNASVKTLQVGTGATGATGSITTSGDITVGGNLTVNGTTTTVNSTILTVDDINIELGSVTTPSNTTADGGGITLKGTTDKTLNWVNATSAWTSSEDFNLLTGKVYEINGATVLSATALGSGVTASSLTSLGTIATLSAGTIGATGVNTVNLNSQTIQVGTGATGATGAITTSGLITSNRSVVTTNVGAGTITVGTGATGATGTVMASNTITAPNLAIGTGATGATGAITASLSVNTPTLGATAANVVNIAAQTIEVGTGATGATGSINALVGAFTNNVSHGTITVGTGATGATGTITASAVVTAPTFTSNVITGTAPFTVTSTTQVANLNASTLGGNTFVAPGNIGTTTPGGLTGTGANIGGATGVLGATGTITAAGLITSNRSVVTTNVGAGTITVGTGATGATGTITASAVVTAPTFTSNVITGTAPFTVTSTTQVANLNAATAGTATNVSGSGTISTTTISATTIGASGITTNTLTAGSIVSGATSASGYSGATGALSGLAGYFNSLTLGGIDVDLPSGAIVGTTDTQTLTNKTFTGYVETVFAASGTTPALSPTNGTIQTWTLSGASTPTAGTWSDGAALTLMIQSSANTVTWTSLPVTWVGGVAPILSATASYNIIELWKVGSVIYGVNVGNA